MICFVNFDSWIWQHYFVTTHGLLKLAIILFWWIIFVLNYFSFVFVLGYLGLFDCDDVHILWVAVIIDFCANSKLHCLSLVLFNCIRESLLLRGWASNSRSTLFLCLFPNLNFFLYWFVSFSLKHLYFFRKLISTYFFTKQESDLLGTTDLRKILVHSFAGVFSNFQLLNASNLVLV